MNAGQESRVTRGLSASNEARQMMADWLRITQAQKSQLPDYRAMLTQRYPSGLLNEAELEALLGILKN
ncbi:hypothetical protein DBY65_010610 [Pseudomonas sp. RIT412]|nr:hypothetical protein DBP26_004455 [Pseudomonas sp. RIT 409]RAU53975.1 hypothetical protein DBY65_010610 [Pseudomonas sp. RIT 412]